jgi:hypothetical protein
VASLSGEVKDVMNPAADEMMARLSLGARADGDVAVETAEDAFWLGGKRH